MKKKNIYIYMYSIYVYTSTYFLTPAISLKIQLYDVGKSASPNITRAMQQKVIETLKATK